MLVDVNDSSTVARVILRNEAKTNWKFLKSFAEDDDEVDEALKSKKKLRSLMSDALHSIDCMTDDELKVAAKDVFETAESMYDRFGHKAESVIEWIFA